MAAGKPRAIAALERGPKCATLSGAPQPGRDGRWATLRAVDLPRRPPSAAGPAPRRAPAPWPPPPPPPPAGPGRAGLASERARGRRPAHSLPRPAALGPRASSRRRDRSDNRPPAPAAENFPPPGRRCAGPLLLGAGGIPAPRPPGKPRGPSAQDVPAPPAARLAASTLWVNPPHPGPFRACCLVRFRVWLKRM